MLAPLSVDSILDKENFTLKELLDHDDILEKSNVVNERLITFLSQKEQIKQFIEYAVLGTPDDTAQQRNFSFIACEIFMWETENILKALVEDEEMIDMLFSFLDPERHHSEQLSRYFSKVVICLLMRKTTPLMSYIQAYQEDILRKLVDLIGITSIMEVLIRLLSVDYSIYPDSMQWLHNIDVLEMIVDKFSSSDCLLVHGNAAETLCAIARYAPPVLASKVSSPSFIEKMFRLALNESRPKSVLANLLSVCISLLDPQRETSDSSYVYTLQMTCDRAVNPNIVKGMLKSLGDFFKLLDLSPEDNVLLTTYGKVQPPFGTRRLKVVEFIAALIGASNGIGDEELIRLGVVKRIIELFFEYPYNNFLHHNVERVIESCLESKNSRIVEHLFLDCNLIGKILEAEKNPNLAVSTTKHTLPAEGKSPRRMGNFGHITRIANKIVQIGNSHEEIQKLLQGNSDWVDWQTSVLFQRNTVENVLNWDCGRPSSSSDEEAYEDTDYNVDSLNQGLQPALGSGYPEEEHYFGDEYADEAILSSLDFNDQQRYPILDGEASEGVADMATIWSAIVGGRKQISEDNTETDSSKPDEAQSLYFPVNKIVLEYQTDNVVSDKKDADKPEDDCKTNGHGKSWLGSHQTAKDSQSRKTSKMDVINIDEVD